MLDDHVSWLVALSAQCEHPDWTAAAGAQYIASKIDAIAANPKVWAKTAFILMYDENDGYFDHVPPVTAPAGTADEYVDGVPIGLGFRVPCTIVSPWTVGGYVATETFDHTSLIRFLETRFGVTEPNISAWRRQTVGDLTSAFQFSQPRPFPAANQALTVPSSTLTLVAAQQEVANNPAPTIPAVNTPPVQDTTSRTGFLRPSAS
jgi:phospholipase C